MTYNTLVQLTLVENREEIRQVLVTFNNEVAENQVLARKILRTTSYWVFNPDTEAFGPSKFLGFKNMNFSKHTLARDGKWAGDRFDGHESRKAIEAYLGVYEPDQELSAKIEEWGERLLGSGIFDNIKTDKWRFVSL
jgi:hypothetical protein